MAKTKPAAKYRTAYDEPAHEWIARLKADGLLPSALNEYSRSIRDYGLGAAAIDLRERFSGVTKQELFSMDQLVIETADDRVIETSNQEVLSAMQANLQWALNNVGNDEPGPNGTARAYREMADQGGLQKIAELLLKVTALIDKSASPEDETLAEDHRKQMSLIQKLQPLIERDISVQCDDIIRMHMPILVQRLDRQGIRLEKEVVGDAV